MEAAIRHDSRAVRRRYAEASRDIRAAWTWWWTMLLAPWAAVLMGAMMYSLHGGPDWTRATGVFFGVATVWIAGVAPGAMVLRSHCLRAMWRGRSLPADRYLRGMLTIWWALEIGILIAVTGALSTRTVLPCLMPAAVAWVWLAVLAPSDRAVMR